MKNSFPRLFRPRLLAVSAWLALFLVAGVASGKTTKPPATVKTAPVTNTIPAATIVEIPESVFVIPASPKEGRNPFFPQSTARPPLPGPKPGPGGKPTTDLTELMINGFTSLPKRTVMINNRTFEPGETGEVKLPRGGKVLLKCEEIRADSVIISVNGQLRELRLRPGL